MNREPGLNPLLWLVFPILRGRQSRPDWPKKSACIGRERKWGWLWGLCPEHSHQVSWPVSSHPGGWAPFSGRLSLCDSRRLPRVPTSHRPISSSVEKSIFLTFPVKVSFGFWSPRHGGSAVPWLPGPEPPRHRRGHALRGEGGFPERDWVTSQQEKGRMLGSENNGGPSGPYSST